MDTPRCPRPRDARQAGILDELVRLRDKLLLIKHDPNHIKNQDIMPLYDQLVDRVGELNQLRAGPAHSGGETQLDRVLESCFQLFSLAFLTVGRNDEAPAAFALTSTVSRLVDHLLEKEGLYSYSDLDRLGDTLDRLESIVKSRDCSRAAEGDACKKSPYLAHMLEDRISRLQKSVAGLKERLSGLRGGLASVHERLIAILREISAENTRRSGVSTKEVSRLRAQVAELDELRCDGKFLSPDGALLQGNDYICSLIEIAYRWADLVIENKGVIPEQYAHTYHTLISIRDSLEKLSVTQTWSMRETDLYDFQRKIDRIDESRTRQGKAWLDENGEQLPEYVQWTLGYLIRKNYALILIILTASEPVSSALLPVLAQLQTLKRCLVEVRDGGGVDSIRELYPYHMKLESIRNQRTDGKFMNGTEVPHGQLALAAVLGECTKIHEGLLADCRRKEQAAADAGDQEAAD